MSGLREGEWDDAASLASGVSAGQTLALPENAKLVLQMPGGDESSRGGGNGGGSGSGPNFDPQHMGDRPNPSAYVRDVRGAFQGLPKVKPQWQDRYMTIMVCGESGLGKTTFIQNLFASYAQDPNLRVAGVSGPTSKEVFANNPQQLCTTIDVEDPETRTRYHYAVQDTPGWDNLEDNLDNILEHVQGRHLKCLEAEQDARRLGPMHKTPDPRVDVCLYFISPHRCKSIDVEFIAKISGVAPVVPVLAKADCMTKDELKSFRKTVRETLQTADRAYGREVMYSFSAEALEEAHPTAQVPPFAVVSSREMDSSVGRYWPVRRYPWGKCEALSSDHSDVAALKKLLLETGFEEFKAKTEERYYHYREEELLNLHDDDGRGRRIKPRFILNRDRERALPIKVLKWTAGVVVTYGLAAFLLRGREGLEHDAQKARERASQVGETLGEISKNTKEYIETKTSPPPPPRRKFLGIF